MDIVMGPGQFLHLIDGNWPADEEDGEGDAVIPVVVAVKFLFAVIYLPLEGFQLFPIDNTPRCSHVLVFDPVEIIYLLVEQGSKDKSERNRSYNRNGSSPNDHGLAQVVLVSVDGSDEHAEQTPVDEEDVHAGDSGKEFFVSQEADGIERPGGPFIFLEATVVDIRVGGIGAQIE